MTRLVKADRSVAHVACLSAFLAISAGCITSAYADSTVACSALSAQTADGHSAGLQVLKSEPLYRFQDRPYLRIPQGVALWVRAPRGLTAADLHNLLVDCRSARQTASVLCVKGAQVDVTRRGGQYVVRVTSDDRGIALEIQRRASAH